MMRRLLVVLAAALLFGAQLTSHVEAQGWSCTYDFVNGQQGWSAFTAGYEANWNGSSWTHYDKYFSSAYRRGVDISMSMGSTTVTSLSATISYSAGTFNGGANNAGFVVVGSTTVLDWTIPSYPSNPVTWSGSVSSATAVRIGIVASTQTSASYNGSASITSIVLSGTGTQPSNCGATPTPVPPTATITPVPSTSTPAPPTATPEVWVINTFLTPTPITVDASGLYEALQQGNDSVLRLPPDLEASGALPIEDGSEIFAYVKWIVSPSSADEIAGPFAPIVSHSGIFLTVTFFMAVVYAVVWVAVFLFRFVIWIFKFILLIVDLVLQFAQAVGAFVGGIVKFFLG